MLTRVRIGFALSFVVCTGALAPSFYWEAGYRMGPCPAYIRQLDAGGPVAGPLLHHHCIPYDSDGRNLLALAYVLVLLAIGFGLAFRVASSRSYMNTATVGATSTLVAAAIGFAVSGAPMGDMFVGWDLYAVAVFTTLYGLTLQLLHMRVAA
jgi:hypothetical protein